MHGLYYTHQGQVLALPLLAVRAHASIKELSARVVLTQTYTNVMSFAIEAKYSFPIPARASVYGFVMVKQDGTRVVGSVLEKHEARKTYTAAVEKGHQASLVEQHSPDTFQVSVGNIPPNQQVQIELSYATELAEDEENDSVRFHLPVHIGQRYGRAPASTPSPFPDTFLVSSSAAPFLSITADVEAVAAISKIGSPTHTVSTELGPDPTLPNFKELPFSNYARVSLSSDSALEKDFVLAFKSAGLDAPRCIAEPHPTYATIAVALSFVPRFSLPDLARQEFILLVDRSGSMGGARIAAARKALVVLLRALPHQDTRFQVVSFGSRATLLWPDGSRAYTQATLEEATRHVDGMRADYGGTEIRAALETCFRARARDRPTSVLVLTDGEAHDVDRVLQAVKGAVAAAPDTAPLRVSVLGIGNSVSTAMCEGIARVGNGTCMLVVEEETTFTGKVARLLKAARTPMLSNITVDWGNPVAAESALEDDFEVVENEQEVKDVDVKQKDNVVELKTPLNVFDEATDPTHLDDTGPPPPTPVVLPPPPAVQQSPFKIRNLFPGTRVNVYAILQGRSSIPQTVTLRGVSPDGAEIALPVPVTPSRLPSTPALHALAARKIIQDLEDGQHDKALADPADADLLARTVRASIVRLGTTYSISSTHTSFVAVDETLPSPPLPAVKPAATRTTIRARARYQFVDTGSDSESDAGEDAVDEMAATMQLMAVNLSKVAERGERLDSLVGSTNELSASAQRFRRSVHVRRIGVSPSRSCCPLLTSLKPELDQQNQRIQRLDSMADSLDSKIASNSSRLSRLTSASASAPVAAPADADAEDPLEVLARLQSFDGAFDAPLAVLTVPGLKLNEGRTLDDVRALLPPVQLRPDGAPDQEQADKLLASLLAMAFAGIRMRTGLEADRDAWAGLYEKVRSWVEGTCQNIGAPGSVAELEEKIVAMLVGEA
ncbi:von Willebrand factor type A domain-containing protein [Mycena filopes]|nr:von Willebrand factor type A domain-containing protein [Mycena filopes]